MATRITATIIMTETATLIRLMSWLSPVFPTGGFAYSAGLEQAANDESVYDETSLSDWLSTQIEHGTVWNDTVFLVQAHHACNDLNQIAELSALARAMTPSQQRLAEMCLQGTSFLEAATCWFEPNQLPEPETPLAVAIGCATGLEKVACAQACAAYIHAFITNQLQAAIRLSLIGQSGAGRLLASLEPVIGKTGLSASHATHKDLGSAAIIADIAAMNHETLEPRLFRS